MFQIESQAVVSFKWVSIVGFGETDLGWELENPQQSPSAVYLPSWMSPLRGRREGNKRKAMFIVTKSRWHRGGRDLRAQPAGVRMHWMRRSKGGSRETGAPSNNNSMELYWLGVSYYLTLIIIITPWPLPWKCDLSHEHYWRVGLDNCGALSCILCRIFLQPPWPLLTRCQ